MGEAARTLASCGTEIEDMIQEWAAATEWCHRALGQPSDEAVNWQPFNRSHSIAGILLHLADVEGLWMEEHLAQRKRSTDELLLLRSHENQPNDATWTKPPALTLQGYLDILEWTRQRSLAALRNVPGPDHPFEGPTGWITVRDAVRHLYMHEAYHIGQAVLHDLHFGWNGVEPS